MSGSDEKFEIIEEARVKYGRLNDLLGRLPTPPAIPSELKVAMENYREQGAVYNSMELINKLSEYAAQIELPSVMREELQRIVDWNEYFEFNANPEVKAQPSADYIHQTEK